MSRVFHYYSQRNTPFQEQYYLNQNALIEKKPSFSNLSLPIQAIVQAAFFNLFIGRSTVAGSRLITRQRLHIHIDICDEEKINSYSNQVALTISQLYFPPFKNILKEEKLRRSPIIQNNQTRVDKDVYQTGLT